MNNRIIANVIGTQVDALGYSDVICMIDEWGRLHSSRVIAICNAHSLVSARYDDAFGSAVGTADLVTPDGFPVAWMMRRLGFPDQERVCGPDLMLKYCERAARSGVPMFLYGSSPETLSKLQYRLERLFPGVNFVGAISPPFRALSDEEDQAFVDQINESGAQVVWVGLGCPKQELWMQAHKTRINAVMIGVGAAFDFHSERISRAPAWMRKIGLEWLHRLASEPRRLWKRYFVTNSLFIWHSVFQLLRSKLHF